jgi:hypothetical protein
MSSVFIFKHFFLNISTLKKQEQGISQGNMPSPLRVKRANKTRATAGRGNDRLFTFS